MKKKLILLIIIINSCSYPEMVRDELIYQNDFENSNLVNIDGAIVIRFYDELFQPNAIDNMGVNQEKCDESWSLDNLKIRAIKYK